jgi:amylosucrase
MYNPRTGDGRITGSAASLLGLEKGLKTKSPKLVDSAIDKIAMLYGIIFSYGGIPMIYAGDEIGAINDYSYLNEEDKRDDNRWLNRPIHDWEAVASIRRDHSISSRIFKRLQHLIALRKKHEQFADRHLPILHEPNNTHVFVFERAAKSKDGILVICNFDENNQALDSGWIASLGYVQNSKYHDLISGKERKLNSGLLSLSPYELLWLKSY